MFKLFLKLCVVIGLLFSTLISRDLSYVSGWQMKGYGGYNNDINATKFILNNPTLSIWAYQDNSWKVNYLHRITDPTFYPALLKLKNNEGFWIKAPQSGNINLPDVNFKTLPPICMHIKNGWHMYGYDSEISPISFNNPYIKIVWQYDTALNKWKAYSSYKDISDILTLMGVDKIDNIKRSEGFWVYSSNDIDQNITLPQAPHLKDTSLSLLSDAIQDSSAGYIDFAERFSGNITGYELLGEDNDTFMLSTTGSLILKKPENINFNSKPIYRFKVQAHSDKGDSNIVNLYVYVGKKPLSHIVASDARKYDFAGDVLAFNSDELFLGVYKADVNGRTDAGKVYIFSDFTQDGNYSEKSFTGEYPATLDNYGKSLAIFGDHIAIGVPGKRYGYEEAGIALVGSIKSDGTIDNFTELSQNSDTITKYHGFGQSLAMNDKNILVGSKSLGDPTVYWYHKDSYGNFILKGEIKPLDENSTDFGQQIAMSGDYFATLSLKAKKLYLYKFNGNDYELLDTIQNDHFFPKIAMDGAYLAVAADQSKQSVFLYKIVDNNITQIATIKPKTDTTLFGINSLSLKNGYIAIGESDDTQDTCSISNISGGSIYLYHLDENDTISLLSRFKECAKGYGNGVAIGDNFIAVGSTYQGSYINGAYTSATGGVYLYGLR